MALTIKEQHLVKTSKIQPEAMSLLDMVSIFGYTHAQYFIDNQKATDPGSLAESYKNKMLSFGNQIKQKNGTSLLSLVDALINVWKNFLFYTDMKAWNDNSWETNVSNSLPEAFEKAAGVLPAEKLDYDGLPSE